MYIDWSSSDEMLTLLVEYVEDERLQERFDRAREKFLAELADELYALEALEPSGAHRVRLALEAIAENQPREFSSDPVLVHLHACIDEMSRISEDIHRAEATSASNTP